MPAIVLAAMILLGGCSERLFGGNESVEPLSPAPGRPPGAPGAARSVPPVEMAGRWLLASPGAGTCAMTFGLASDSAEGTIAPEGGCPGNFFTSRRWIFSDGALVIRDHKGEPLAQLALAAPGRFEGQAATGEAVWLTR